MANILLTRDIFFKKKAAQKTESSSVYQAKFLRLTIISIEIEQFTQIMKMLFGYLNSFSG